MLIFFVDCDRKPLTWSTRYARIAFAYFINNFLVSERALSNKRVLLLPGFQSRSPAIVLDCSQVSIFSYFHLITAEAVNSIFIPLSATFTLTSISTAAIIRLAKACWGSENCTSWNGRYMAIRATREWHELSEVDSKESDIDVKLCV